MGRTGRGGRRGREGGGGGAAWRENGGEQQRRHGLGAAAACSSPDGAAVAELGGAGCSDSKGGAGDDGRARREDRKSARNSNARLAVAVIYDQPHRDRGPSHPTVTRTQPVKLVRSPSTQRRAQRNPRGGHDANLLPKGCPYLPRGRTCVYVNALARAPTTGLLQSARMLAEALPDGDRTNPSQATRSRANPHPICHISAQYYVAPSPGMPLPAAALALRAVADLLAACRRPSVR